MSASILQGPKNEDIAWSGGTGLFKDEGRVGEWFQTWTGKRFYFEDPRPEDIDILDICFSLGNTSRYNGHARRYSTAEHSILVSKLCSGPNKPVAFGHDFAESYITDITRPLKRTMKKDNILWAIEDNIWTRAIAPKYGFPLVLPEEVVMFDTAICKLEKRVLMPRSQAWHIPFPEPKGIRINCYPAHIVHLMFLDRWCDLTGESRYALKRDFLELKRQDAVAFADQEPEMQEAA